eukprot:365859-Chlamydomonas_euryale.AAC.3
MGRSIGQTAAEVEVGGCTGESFRQATAGTPGWSGWLVGCVGGRGGRMHRGIFQAGHFRKAGVERVVGVAACAANVVKQQGSDGGSVEVTLSHEAIGKSQEWTRKAPACHQHQYNMGISMNTTWALA